MGKKVAVVVADEFEDSELTHPLQALKDAGHQTVIIGSKAGATQKGKRGDASIDTDLAASDARAADYAALLIPGGHSPDHLRTDPDVVAFVQAFDESRQVIAAVCHGPQLLIEADRVRGRRMTSFASVKTDLMNAGADWVDEKVVVDGNLVTSRNPDDLDAFSDALVARLEKVG